MGKICKETAILFACGITAVVGLTGGVVFAANSIVNNMYDDAHTTITTAAATVNQSDIHNSSDNSDVTSSSELSTFTTVVTPESDSNNEDIATEGTEQVIDVKETEIKAEKMQTELIVDNQSKSDNTDIESVSEIPIEDENEYYDIYSNENVVLTEDGRTIYHIQKGDTLSSISSITGVSVNELAEFNHIYNVNMIFADSSLQIPVKD